MAIYFKKKWVIAFFIALLLALLLNNLAGEAIAKIFFALLAGLTPIIIGMIIAFLLKEPVKFLQKKLSEKVFKRKKNPEKLASLISLIVVFLAFVGIIGLIIWLIIPTLLDVITQIVNNSSEYIQKIEDELTSFVASLQFVSDVETREFINQLINEIVASLSNREGTATEQISNAFSIVGTILGTTFLSLFFAFLFIKEREKIAKYSYRTTYAYLGKQKGDSLVAMTKKADRILLDYAVSKLIEAVIIFTLIGVVFLLMGVPIPFILSFIMAILNVIPYIGPIIALVPIGLATIVLASVNLALWAIAISIGIVLIITGFVTPIIVGKKINLKLLWVLIALVIGGAMFGMIGLIFAPPIMALIIFYFNHKLEVKESEKSTAEKKEPTLLQKVKKEEKERTQEE